MVESTKKKFLIELGELFSSCAKGELESGDKYAELISKGVELIENVHFHNSWFTADSVQHTFHAWGNSLLPEKIEKWLSPYPFNKSKKNTVGVIAAGNIPLVGLHDVLCVLLNGDNLVVKLSSKDQL